MIPSASGFPSTDYEVQTYPTYTYKMWLEEGVIRGYTDYKEAMKQVIYCILSTERYKYVIYSWNYGVELADLFGMPTSFVCPELERRITEALTWDSRIESVDDFEFDLTTKGVVAVTFKVNTIYGSVDASWEVNV